MSFFQNLGKKVGDAAKGVKEKTDELAAIAKLNKSIADENKKIAQAYTDIGKKFTNFTSRVSLYTTVLPTNAKPLI